MEDQGITEEFLVEAIIDFLKLKVIAEHNGLGIKADNKINLIGLSPYSADDASRLLKNLLARKRMQTIMRRPTRVFIYPALYFCTSEEITELESWRVRCFYNTEGYNGLQAVVTDIANSIMKGSLVQLRVEQRRE